jgi:hypothetical protein
MHKQKANGAECGLGSRRNLFRTLIRLQDVVSKRGCPGGILGQFMWNFWWTNWHRYKFFAGYFGVRQSVFVPTLLWIHSLTIGILHPHNAGVDKWTRRKYLYIIQTERTTVNSLTIIWLQNCPQIYVFIQLSVTENRGCFISKLQNFP